MPAENEKQVSAPLVISAATALAAIKAAGSTTCEDPVDIVEYVRTGDGEMAARLVARAFGLSSSPPAIEVSGALSGASAQHVVKLRGCARCGGTHEGLMFRPLERPVARDGDEIATHWAACPANGEPILMIAVKSQTGDEA